MKNVKVSVLIGIIFDVLRKWKVLSSVGKWKESAIAIGDISELMVQGVWYWRAFVRMTVFFWLLVMVHDLITCTFGQKLQSTDRCSHVIFAPHHFGKLKISRNTNEIISFTIKPISIKFAHKLISIINWMGLMCIKCNANNESKSKSCHSTNSSITVFKFLINACNRLNWIIVFLPYWLQYIVPMTSINWLN